MARPKNSLKGIKNKNCVLQVRVDQNECDSIKERAQKCGKNVSQFIRDILLVSVLGVQLTGRVEGRNGAAS